MPKWLVNNKFTNSMGEARRLLDQGAVRIIHTDGTAQVIRDQEVEIRLGDRIRVGKLRLAEIVNADKEKV
jgi:tyrosyl-tRNA synthetase